MINGKVLTGQLVEMPPGLVISVTENQSFKYSRYLKYKKR